MKELVTTWMYMCMVEPEQFRIITSFNLSIWKVLDFACSWLETQICWSSKVRGSISLRKIPTHQNSLAEAHRDLMISDK